MSKIFYSGISKRSGDEELYKGLGETGEIYIVNNNRLMITESRFVSDAILKQVVDTDGVRHTFDNGIGMTSIYPDYRGILTLGVSKYVEEMDWVILAEKDVGEAFAPVIWLRNLFIIIGASSILIMLVIAILISNGITKSIKKLIRGTRRIADGDLDQPIKINEMDGEIKELGVSFNVMMQELGKSTHENHLLYLQVKKGRDEWRKTFDTITDIISIHDKNHKIIMANRAFYEKFKIDKKELSGKLCTEVFFGIDSNRQCCPIDKSKKSALPESEVIDDPYMGGFFIKSTYPMKDEKGKIYAYVHIAKDITLQKELQAELIEKASELERVNKELEDFIYLTSHDLKEPLFAISGYTSRLSNIYNDVYDETGRKYVNRIKANTKKMNQRIHDIMEVLRAGKVEYNHEECDSFATVNDVIKDFDERLLENRVKISIDDDLPTIYCDKMRIKDVFSNLISNAIKFIDSAVSSSCIPPEYPLASVLSLSSEDKGKGNYTQPRNITIGCKKDKSYYKFFVEDTGIGIHENHQDQIFMIFKRLNDIDTEGTGVGLAIVKKIIEQHKGSIWVESPVYEGRGSRFCFTIPIYENRNEGTEIG
ncbi:MAG: HAMP domain-containing protein [Candidatus Brocadiales bacterium]|nr:HAMP domain-containing protein [Candidatus Brocadiales bacterium]